jgi:hypothetical protein
MEYRHAHLESAPIKTSNSGNGFGRNDIAVRKGGVLLGDLALIRQDLEHETRLKPLSSPKKRDSRLSP